MWALIFKTWQDSNCNAWIIFTVSDKQLFRKLTKGNHQLVCPLKTPQSEGLPESRASVRDPPK